MSIKLPPLPYALDALEPHLSRRTLGAHHGHHQATYVEKVNSLVQGTSLAFAPLEEIVRTSARQKDMPLFHAAAQAWNHDFYWRSMKPGGGGVATGSIAGLIEDSFGSQDAFGEEFDTAAVDHFGSGWVWLVLDGSRLRVTATADADTPLTRGQVPLLVIDVWEHAYYLDYEYRRPEYVTVFLAFLADWDFANRNFKVAQGDGGAAIAAVR